MKQEKLIIQTHEGEECSVAVWQRQLNTESSSATIDTHSLKHNNSTTDLNTIDSRRIQELIDFNNSDRIITTACQVRKNNTNDDLYENSNKSGRINRNPEKLVARLCSEPQTGELVTKVKK